MRSVILNGLRYTQKMNQFKAADVAGCSRAAYQIKEDEIERFTLGEAMRLCKFFGKTLNDMFGTDYSELN